MKIIALSAVLVILVFSTAMADWLNVNMKDGSILKGILVSRAPDFIVIQDRGGNRMNLRLADIGSAYDVDTETYINLQADWITVNMKDGNRYYGSLISKSPDILSLQDRNGSRLNIRVFDINSAYDETSGNYLNFSTSDYVNVLMKDGMRYTGNLAGKTPNVLTIQDDNGDIMNLNTGDVDNVFDVDTGTYINLYGNGPVDDPDIIVIPNTYVYYYNYQDYDCFFYGGYWWRHYPGGWFRSPVYSGDWAPVNPLSVPVNIINLPINWRESLLSAPRVGWISIRANWRDWETSAYWGNHGWRPSATVVQRHNINGNYYNENNYRNSWNRGNLNRRQNAPGSPEYGRPNNRPGAPENNNRPRPKPGDQENNRNPNGPNGAPRPR